MKCNCDSSHLNVVEAVATNGFGGQGLLRVRVSYLHFGRRHVHSALQPYHPIYLKYLRSLDEPSLADPITTLEINLVILSII